MACSGLRSRRCDSASATIWPRRDRHWNRKPLKPYSCANRRVPRTSDQLVSVRCAPADPITVLATLTLYSICSTRPPRAGNAQSLARSRFPSVVLSVENISLFTLARRGTRSRARSRTRSRHAHRQSTTPSDRPTPSDTVTHQTHIIRLLRFQRHAMRGCRTSTCAASSTTAGATARRRARHRSGRRSAPPHVDFSP
jgi:hypothetical protein